MIRVAFAFVTAVALSPVQILLRPPHHPGPTALAHSARPSEEGRRASRRRRAPPRRTRHPQLIRLCENIIRTQSAENRAVPTVAVPVVRPVRHFQMTAQRHLLARA